MISFKEFVEINKNIESNFLDYIYNIIKSNQIHPDFFLCLYKLLCPKFFLIKERIFLEENFQSKYYEESIKDKLSIHEIQFWQNLIEVTGFVEDLEIDDAIKFAETLAEIWNLKIEKEYGFEKGKARSIYDEDLGEVFVTID